MNRPKFCQLIETTTDKDGKRETKVGKYPYSTNRLLREMSKRGLYGEIMYTLKKNSFAKLELDDGSIKTLTLMEIDREAYNQAVQ